MRHLETDFLKDISKLKRGISFVKFGA